MKRRSYLAGMLSVAATTSGCIASGYGSSGETMPKNVTSISVDIKDDSSLMIDSELIDSEISKESTATIQLTIKWNGDNDEILAFRNQIPFSTPQISDNTNDIVLLHDDHKYPRQNEDHWVPATHNPDDFGAQTLNLEYREMEPGEAITSNWGIWANPKSAREIKPGEYSFNNSVSLLEGGEAKRVIEWEMALSIED